MTIADHDRLVPSSLPVATPASASEATTFSLRVAYLLAVRHDAASGASGVLAALRDELPGVLARAFEHHEPAALLEAHQALFAIYEAVFANPLSIAASHEGSPWLGELRSRLEEAWMGDEVRRIESQLPSESELRDPPSLCAWFVEQAGREAPLDKRVIRFLAERASLEQFKHFVLADAHLNYRFYDALVLASLHFSERVKGEICQHVWDECGVGNPELAHTRQFSRALEKLSLPIPTIPVWEDFRPYAGYNLYLCLGLSRRHYFKSLGSLAMPELFDPGRDRAVVEGLERLGYDAPREFEYYYGHIGGDEAHGDRWLEHVVTPIVDAQPEAARELAIGAVLRMDAMRRYNEYLAEAFGIARS